MNSETAKATRLTYYATQIELGWITLERVPKRYRDDVAKLIEANQGLDNE
ncbi:hypothetical protein [Streptococcus moroccensis]|uniref:Phage protein n=1 Tax=Streptococcus moroccensis TaxID=1451356 RepID=A0ABT9YQH1_9STRE|nr:hypothetical protein [Streptococcus moroccensis]MDQ0221974.1 hypothetical protein [Streptococcus moroccensis]